MIAFRSELLSGTLFGPLSGSVRGARTKEANMAYDMLSCRTIFGIDIVVVCRPGPLTVLCSAWFSRYY